RERREAGIERGPVGESGVVDGVAGIELPLEVGGVCSGGPQRARDGEILRTVRSHGRRIPNERNAGEDREEREDYQGGAEARRPRFPIPRWALRPRDGRPARRYLALTFAAPLTARHGPARPGGRRAAGDRCEGTRYSRASPSPRRFL